MWLLTFLSHLQSISTLRSLSWGASVLLFLLLLAGLYVWNSNIWLLNSMISELIIEHTKNDVKVFKDGQLLPSVPQELLMQTVTQLAADYRVDRRRVTILSVLFLTTAGVALWQEVRSRDIDVYHDVHVLKKFDDFNFQMEVQDPDTKQWNTFGVTFCNDYRPTDEIQPGVTLTLLKDERDPRKHCFEIAPRDLGYTILRGDHNVPIIADRR